MERGSVCCHRPGGDDRHITRWGHLDIQTSGTDKDLESVGGKGDQRVAVGSLGAIVTSPDGVTWTSQTSGTSEELTGVAAP
jgi:hypothetical protein